MTNAEKTAAAFRAFDDECRAMDLLNGGAKTGDDAAIAMACYYLDRARTIRQQAGLPMSAFLQGIDEAKVRARAASTAAK